MDAQKLKEKIVEKNVTVEAVAKAADMDRSTFYRKMQEDNKGFTVKEVKAIVCFLELERTEADDIFYD